MDAFILFMLGLLMGGGGLTLMIIGIAVMKNAIVS